MHTKSDNIEIMNGIETNDAINEFYNSFLKRYQEELETKMKGSGLYLIKLIYWNIIFDKITLNRGSSHIDSHEWLKNEKATINPKNTIDEECFEYAIINALHHQEIGRNSQRMSKLKPFIVKYNWKDIEFPSHSKDWKKFEQNNKTIAPNILYVPYNTKQIRLVYISKYNHKRDKHVNLLMITDNMNNWHYCAVKNIPGLLRGITSNHNVDFYCLNCFHSCRTKKNLKSVKGYAKT